MLTSIRQALGAWMAMACLGCGPRNAAPTVRDSARVRIVDNDAPLLASARAWRLAPAPSVDIGTTSGDSIYELDMVMGVVRLRDGAIALANQRTGTIRFFDATGRFLHAAGRPGQGPGEFRQLLGLYLIRGDTLFAVDQTGIRLFTSDGKYVRDGATRASPGRFISPAAVFTDGSYMGLAYTPSRTERSGTWTDSITAYRVTADGTRADSIGRLPHAHQTFDATAGFATQLLFGPKYHVAATTDGFYYGFAERYSIELYTPAGALVRIVRRAAPSRRIPSSVAETYRARVLAITSIEGRPVTPEQRDRLRSHVQRARFADVFPAFADLLVDRAGNLWVSRYEPWVDMPRNGVVFVPTSEVPTQWDVFDPDGRWLCTVGLPTSFAPMDIGADYVAGLWRDGDGVEHVRLHRLIKP